MYIGIHTYKIVLIYIYKIRVAKLKKWCVYVCGKKRRGGGVELHIGMEMIFHFFFYLF